MELPSVGSCLWKNSGRIVLWILIWDLSLSKLEKRDRAQKGLRLMLWWNDLEKNNSNSVSADASLQTVIYYNKMKQPKWGFSPEAPNGILSKFRPPLIDAPFWDLLCNIVLTRRQSKESISPQSAQLAWGNHCFGMMVARSDRFKRELHKYTEERFIAYW